MKKIMPFIIIGIILLAVIVFIGYQYIDGLASGWGSKAALSWNLTVSSYDELVADENNGSQLEGIFQTRLWTVFRMHTKVRIDSSDNENIQVFVSVEDVLVPEGISEDDFDPEWHKKNNEAKIDDVHFPTEYQSWDITSHQKACISEIIKERITFITDDNIVIIEELGKWRQR